MMGWMPFEAVALGRLFFTPQERMMLEKSTGPADSPAATKDTRRNVKTATLTANGWLWSGERERIWLNGGERQPGSYRFDSGEIRVRWRGRVLALKPGQTAVETPGGKIVIREFGDD